MFQKVFSMQMSSAMARGDHNKIKSHTGKEEFSRPVKKIRDDFCFPNLVTGFIVEDKPESLDSK